MADAPYASDNAERLSLERFKLQLDFRKFVLGTVVAGITIAAIPPLFQLATAALEYVKAQHELTLRQEADYETFVTQFLNTALDQDIERRIRFADYFANVSASSYQPGWISYRDELVRQRDRIRDKIDVGETEWEKDKGFSQQDIHDEILARQLGRFYKETGYLEPNRSITPNPRTSEGSTGSADSGRAVAKSFYYGELDRFPEFGPRLSCEAAAQPSGVQSFAQQLCGEGQKAMVTPTGSWGGNRCGYTRFSLTCTKS